jgi:CP family cyanate transporter-like MFS transporter
MAQRSADAATAAATSGMSQSVGYLLAAVGPVLFGALYGATGSWVPPLLVLLTGITLQLGAGLLLSRERMVFEPRRPRG